MGRGTGVESRPRYTRERRNMSKRVNISVDLDALQAVIGEWPGIGDVATRLGKTQQDIHNMLNDGRLKGIRTRVGWIIHPACVERVARKRIDHGKRSSSPPKRR